MLGMTACCWKLAQVTFAPYQKNAREQIAPIMEASSSAKDRAFGFNELTSRSILTCPSFPKSQALARNVINKREYSVTSVAQRIGRLRKYLMRISAHVIDMAKTTRMPAKKTAKLLMRSNRSIHFLISFMAGSRRS